MLDLEACLPHRPPSRLVEGILEIDGDRTVCRASISRRAPTADRDTASSLLAFEMGAQAAALIGARASGAGAGTEPAAGSAGLGYLVRIRGATLHQPRLPLEEPLRVTVTRLGAAGPLAMFGVSIAAEADPERVLAEGQLSTFSA